MRLVLSKIRSGLHCRPRGFIERAVERDVPGARRPDRR
jgi:hypothetical protein